MQLFRVGRRSQRRHLGGLAAAPVARALATRLRGRRRRWIGGATALALAGLWLVVLTVAFGSYGNERQATFVASQAGGDALATMLDQEVAMRTFEATCERQSASIVLAGHTDKSGSDQYNQGLSQRRADSVKSYLAGKGVPDAAMTTEAFGESKPLVDTADGVREPQNRRVEITFGPGSGAGAPPAQ